jgi:short-subunit dehydrogenase
LGRSWRAVFAAHGHELALVARRERELGALADEIAGQRTAASFGSRIEPSSGNF